MMQNISNVSIDSIDVNRTETKGVAMSERRFLHVMMPYAHQDDEIGYIMALDEPDTNGNHHKFTGSLYSSDWQPTPAEDWLDIQAQLIEHEFVYRLDHYQQRLLQLAEQFYEFSEQHRRVLHPGTVGYSNVIRNVAVHGIGNAIQQMKGNYNYM
jgi:hypothetical protein